LIIPEVGVKILEGGQEKYGGSDYFKQFQKYSKYDYTALMVKNNINSNKYN
jgi:hypothetical protein